MRDISAVSCVNRRLHQTLASASLYTQSSRLLLPCLKESPLPPLSQPRLARSLALEASVLFQRRPKSNGSREKALRQVQHIPDGGRIIQSILLKSGSHIACLLEDGSMCQYHVASESTTPFSKRHVLPEGCLGVLASLLIPSYCAILSMPSTGMRRYVVSVARTDNSSSTYKSCGTWQQDLILPSTSGSVSLVASSCYKPRLQVSGKRLVAVVRTHMWVLSLTNHGQVIWDRAIDAPGWHAWTIHENFVVALTGR